MTTISRTPRARSRPPGTRGMSSVSANQRGRWRVSPALYKFLLAAHIIVAVGWLGVVVAKLVLGIAVLTSGNPGIVAPLYVSTEVINGAFPPMAIATIVTGVLLSLGTKWGVLQHYWVATKLALTVGVVVTAVQIGDRLVAQASATPSGQTADAVTILGIATTPIAIVIWMAVTHVLMLAAATVISVYKPWGKTWFGRRGVRARRAAHLRGL